MRGRLRVDVILDMESFNLPPVLLKYLNALLRIAVVLKFIILAVGYPVNYSFDLNSDRIRMGGGAYRYVGAGENFYFFHRVGRVWEPLFPVPKITNFSVNDKIKSHIIF